MSQIVEKVHKGGAVKAKIKIVYISNVDYFDWRGGLNFRPKFKIVQIILGGGGVKEIMDFFPNL